MSKTTRRAPPRDHPHSPPAYKNPIARAVANVMGDIDFAGMVRRAEVENARAEADRENSLRERFMQSKRRAEFNRRARSLLGVRAPVIDHPGAALMAMCHHYAGVLQSTGHIWRRTP